MNKIEKFIHDYGCDYETAKAYIENSDQVSKDMKNRLEILINKINQEKKAKIAEKIGKSS